MRCLWFAVAVACTLAPAPTFGQTVPKFPIDASPIGLVGDARPHQYLGVVGRKAAWLGTETGEAEIWVHPLELAARFRLDFKIPDYVEPVRGADVARSVEIRPELTTITYSHATFTVRQHILVPLDEPGVLLLLDVQTVRPLEVVVTFRSVFQYAWPGALGGQFTTWSASEKAFLMSESRRRHNAWLGSPWAAFASDHPAHALPDAPSTIVIAVDRERARTEFVPIAIAAGIAPRADVLAAYTRIMTRAETLYRERREHAARLRNDLVSIDSPDDTLDLAFEWAKVNLDEQMVCNPDLGCGLVAGWGPSGESARPGFGWFFGGDAAINSFAMSSIGMSRDVEQGLRFLATHQRADGKIPHEVSQAAGRIAWFTDFPYAYYHADTTPYWLVAIWKAWRATGNDAFLKELWPAIERAWAWCLTTETDGDGLIENTTGGLGAIEVGAIGEGIHQDIYLAAVWVQAIEAMREMAARMGARDAAKAAGDLEPRARRSLDEKYWLPSVNRHAFGLLRSGKVNDTLTVWPATAAAFGLFEETAGRQTMRALATSEIATDWGARMMTSASPLYDALHYNMGAVWPFVTGFVAWGHYTYARPWAGYPLIDALARLTFDFARGRHAELLSGEFYRPLDTAVPHQFFATSMLVTPIVSGMLGWQPDASRGQPGAGGASGLRPQLPPDWATFKVHRLPAGSAALSMEITQEPGRLRAVFETDAAHAVLATLPVPQGATDVRWSLDGRRWTPAVLQLEAGRRTSVAVSWRGGLSIVPPRTRRQPGEPSVGLRVVDFSWNATTGAIEVEGRAGRGYELTLLGEIPGRIEGATRLRTIPGGAVIGIDLPPGGGQSMARVVLASR